MVMCNRPGCVSEAQPGTDRCYVHLHELGKRCTRCQGSGVIHVTADEQPKNALLPVRLRVACDVCAGTGLIDQTKTPVVKKGVSDQPVDERPMIVLGTLPDTGPDALTQAEQENT